VFRFEVSGRHYQAEEDEYENGGELEAGDEGCAACAGVVDYQVFGIC
jgi:hypothetical protein